MTDEEANEIVLIAMMGAADPELGNRLQDAGFGLLLEIAEAQLEESLLQSKQERDNDRLYDWAMAQLEAARTEEEVWFSIEYDLDRYREAIEENRQ